jgi:hypothetical protein
MVAGEHINRHRERFQEIENSPGQIAIHGVIVEEIAGNENEIDFFFLGRVPDLFQGLEARLANLFGDVDTEAGDAQTEVEISGVKKRNHGSRIMLLADCFKLRLNRERAPPLQGFVFRIVPGLDEKARKVVGGFASSLICILQSTICIPDLCDPLNGPLRRVADQRFRIAQGSLQRW